MLITGDVEKEVSQRLGEKFGEVMDYSWVELGGMKFVKLSYYTGTNSPIVYEGEPSERFKSIIDNVNSFHYRVDQPDPNKLGEGGNCQALSLYLRDTLEANGIKSGLVLDKGIDHMYVWAEIDGVKYNVDMVDKTVTMVE